MEPKKVFFRKFRNGRNDVTQALDAEFLKIHISDKISKRNYFFLKEIRERKTCASYPSTNCSSFNALKDVVLRRLAKLISTLAS